jgi:hypothetical protein
MNLSISLETGMTNEINDLAWRRRFRRRGRMWTQIVQVTMVDWWRQVEIAGYRLRSHLEERTVEGVKQESEPGSERGMPSLHDPLWGYEGKCLL